MKKFKELLDRFMNKAATRQETIELFGKYGDESVKHLFDQEKNAQESGSEKIIKSEVFDEITSKLPELAEEKVVPLRGYTYSLWLKVAAAAVFIMVVVTGVWINKNGSLSRVISQRQADEVPSVYTGKQLVTLPDGSTVLLNENSELTFSKKFGGSNREVSLTGEALFDVKRDPSKPFIVRAGKVSTTVLGTSFNIKAYPGESKIQVTVVHGLVEVEDDLQTYGRIGPDEQIEVDVSSNVFIKRNTKAEEAVAWQEDFFILDNVTFAEAASLIEARFNVNVSISNESLKGCVVSAWFFNNENLKQIVDGLTTLKQATATMRGDTIVIEGGIGCKPSN